MIFKSHNSIRTKKCSCFSHTLKKLHSLYKITLGTKRENTVSISIHNPPFKATKKKQCKKHAQELCSITGSLKSLTDTYELFT